MAKRKGCIDIWAKSHSNEKTYMFFSAILGGILFIASHICFKFGSSNGFVFGFGGLLLFIMCFDIAMTIQIRESRKMILEEIKKVRSYGRA